MINELRDLPPLPHTNRGVRFGLCLEADANCLGERVGVRGNGRCRRKLKRAGNLVLRRGIIKRIWLLFALAASVAGGCSDRPPSDTGAAEATDQTARSEVERGPLKLTVEVEPKQARLSDEPTLTLTLDYQQGLTVDKPPFGEALGEFLILDFHEPPLQVAGDREIIRQVYTLEPSRAGQLTVAPITVTFRDTRPDGDGKQHQVETEGLTIDVTTVLEETAHSLADLRPPASPVELPRAATNALVWWIAGITLVLAAGALLVWRRIRRRAAAEERQLSPYDLAYLELQRLIDADLAESDVKLFFVELTGVVRRYIERTTAVHAPEQTTEEFLREISGHPTFTNDERARLQGFLESADLVKFAAHQPNQQDIEQSFERAKRFIGLAEGVDSAQEAAA